MLKGLSEGSGMGLSHGLGGRAFPGSVLLELLSHETHTHARKKIAAI
jgi:hypothetical protein